VKKRSTKITVENHQVLIIRQRKRRQLGWCPGCDLEVEMVTAEQAAVLLGISLRAVCRAVEADQFHYRETDDGMLYLCLNSLLQSPDEAARNLAPDRIARHQPVLLPPSTRIKKKEH